jgi:hypothetical protein
LFEEPILWDHSFGGRGPTFTGRLPRTDKRPNTEYESYLFNLSGCSEAHTRSPIHTHPPTRHSKNFFFIQEPKYFKSVKISGSVFLVIAIISHTGLYNVYEKVKEKHLNGLEIRNICLVSESNPNMNDTHTDSPNPIFETLRQLSYTR